MLPLSLPAVASAFMLAFLTSFDEFIVAFFLAGTEPTLPLYIWSQLRFPKSLPTVMALGTAILVVSDRHRQPWPRSCAIAGSATAAGQPPPIHHEHKKPKRRTDNDIRT